MESPGGTPTSASSLVDGRPQRIYFHHGIGGIGNYHKVHRIDAANPAFGHRTRLPRSLQAFFSSGTGGVGNLRTISEASALTAEEQLSRARARDSAFPMNWTVGIGGVGNRRGRIQQQPRCSGSSAADSVYSGQALRLGMAEIIRRKIAEKVLRRGNGV
ncbi:hypothetical protein MMC12_003695 [Toensbergia leucococca]|nr:hypothetical protein [Toensbergia leucococca]